MRIFMNEIHRFTERVFIMRISLRSAVDDLNLLSADWWRRVMEKHPKKSSGHFGAVDKRRKNKGRHVFWTYLPVKSHVLAVVGALWAASPCALGLMRSQKKRQCINALHSPRVRTRFKLWFAFWCEKLPSHQICRSLIAAWYSGVSFFSHCASYADCVCFCNINLCLDLPLKHLFLYGQLQHSLSLL